MNNILTPINDISSVTFDELFARYQSLDTECLLIYLFDKVEESALVRLAEQFHITGTEGWTYCQTTEEKRKLIKNSLNLHKYRGTKFALKRALNILGIETEVYEWFEYGGRPYYFKISIDMENRAFDDPFEQLLLDTIFANKNVRSKMETLIVHLLQVVNAKFASAVITSEEVLV